VFTGGSRESIRPFKAIGSFNSQAPILSRSRPGNRHAPIALSPAERVFQVSGNVAAQLSIAEILQFDRDSHPIGNSIQDCRAPDVCVVPVRFDSGCTLKPYNPLLPSK
jgi:hypothetical protein